MTSTPQALLERGRRQAGTIRAIYQRGKQRRAWVRERHTQSPPLRAAVASDVAVTLKYRGEGRGHLSRTELVVETVRLAWVSDAFFAQLLYRGRVAALRRGVPVVPRLCHLGSMAVSQVCIGDPVLIEPGLYLPHGQVVIDGITQVGSDVIVFPWTTIGLRGGQYTGPTVGDGVHVGTGAKVVGPVTVGRDSRLGANTVVVHDVPAQSTVVGVPGHSRAIRT